MTNLLKFLVFLAWGGCVGTIWANEYAHLLSPPSGYSEIRIFSEPLKTRFQMSGSLRPFSFIVNGEPSENLFKKSSKCKVAGISINGQQIKPKGKLGLFYADIDDIGSDSEAVEVLIKQQAKCSEAQIKLKRTLFQKKLEEHFILPNEQVKFPLKKIMQGELPATVQVSLSSGELIRNGDSAKYHFSLIPGENKIVGSIVDESKVNRSFAIPVKVEQVKHDSKKPVLSLSIEDVNWNLDPVTVDSEDLEIEGVTNFNSQLFIQGEVVDIEDDGEFEHEVELSSKETELKFDLTAPNGQRNVITKKVVFPEYRPWPSRWNPGPILQGNWHLRFGVVGFSATYVKDGDDSKIQERLGVNLMVGKNWNDTHHYSFHFNYIDNFSFSNNERSYEVYDHASMGITKDFNLPYSIVAGIGVAFRDAKTRKHSNLPSVETYNQSYNFLFSIEKSIRVYKWLNLSPGLKVWLPTGLAENWDKYLIDIRILQISAQF